MIYQIQANEHVLNLEVPGEILYNQGCVIRSFGTFNTLLYTC